MKVPVLPETKKICDIMTIVELLGGFLNDLRAFWMILGSFSSFMKAPEYLV